MYIKTACHIRQPSSGLLLLNSTNVEVKPSYMYTAREVAVVYAKTYPDGWTAVSLPLAHRRYKPSCPKD